MVEISPVARFTSRRSTVRDPWDADEARRTLAAAGQSGMSLAAFAWGHGLCDGSSTVGACACGRPRIWSPRLDPLCAYARAHSRVARRPASRLSSPTPSSAWRPASTRRRWPRPLLRCARCRAEPAAVDPHLPDAGATRHAQGLLLASGRGTCAQAGARASGGRVAHSCGPANEHDGGHWVVAERESVEPGNGRGARRQQRPRGRQTG